MRSHGAAFKQGSKRGKGLSHVSIENPLFAPFLWDTLFFDIY
jgi:hypothetical protein